MLKNKSSFIDIWNGIVDTHASMCESAYDVLQQGKQKDNMNIYIVEKLKKNDKYSEKDIQLWIKNDEILFNILD